MRQDAQRLLFLSVSISAIVLISEPTLQLAFAASDGPAVVTGQPHIQQKPSLHSLSNHRSILRKSASAKTMTSPQRFPGTPASPLAITEVRSNASVSPSPSQPPEPENQQTRALLPHPSDPKLITQSIQLGHSGTPAGRENISLLGSATPAFQAAAPQSPGQTQTRQPPAPMRRLISEMPGLIQLVTPSSAAPVPPLPTPVPALGVHPISISLSAQQGAGNPPPQTLTITNTGGGTLNWNASASAAWLTISPSSGTGNGLITLSATISSFTPGIYNAMVTLTARNTASINIPVTVTVVGAPIPPAIGASPTTLSFTIQQGTGNPAPQTLSISNTGGGTLAWTASGNVPWLTLSPASGSGNSAATVRATTGTLSVGTYTALVTVSAAGATNVSVPVTFTVTTAPVPPAIGASPTSLSFTGQQGTGNPAPQTLNISNTGGGTLTWTTSENASWLSITPSSGTGNGSITATASVSSLAAGTYNTMLTVSAAGALPLSIPVTFTVTTPPPSLTLNPTALSFSGIQGGMNPASQTMTVTANSNWAASSNAAWLTIGPSSGNSSGSITANVSLSSAPVGTNSATITVTSGSVVKTTSVNLTVTAATMTISSNSLTYAAIQGATPPSPQSITVSSTNGTWTASENASWLSITPTSGTNNGVITASVNPTAATQGNNTTKITVTNGVSSETINVTLTLNPASSSSAILTWNANTESDLAGYRVYQATTSGGYVGQEPIATLQGNVTTYQVTGLQSGTTYHFAITAYDIAGNESAYSNEVNKSIY